MNCKEPLNTGRSGKGKATGFSFILTLLVFLVSSDALMAQQYAVFSHGPTLGRLGSHEIGIWA